MANSHKASVRIRMYRQGLGDCFLLKFNEEGKPEFNMMIDCGVLQKTRNDKAIMTNVVQDIAASLPNGKDDPTKKWLDVVVLTHEHADHISGFTKAEEVFDHISFGEVWCAWLDDEKHPKYKLVRERFHKQINGLKAALSKMGPEDEQGLKGMVEGIVNDFFEDDVLGVGAAPNPKGRSRSWAYAIDKSVADPKFLRPGAMFSLPGFDDVRVYVLGPSEDIETFTQVNPPEGDTYRSEGTNFALMESFFAAVAGETDAVSAETFQPFERRRRIDDATAANMEFFKNHYGFEKDSADSWRRINDDWLSAVGGLALKLDSYTNNTCLALAIEFVSSRKVFLFPGDAQFSNWLSWQILSWAVPDGQGGKQTVTTKDLLERTVLYKVGHHGSHNATLKKHGLEMMTNTGLMAMIPVDQAMARNQTSKSNPDGWEMPEKNLFARLSEKTRGRIILADDKDEEALKKRCNDKSFINNVKFLGSFVRDPNVNVDAEALCIELTIDG